MTILCTVTDKYKGTEREFTISFPSVKVSRSFSSSCDNVWGLIVDTEKWPQWGPSVLAVDCADRFICQGTEGRVKTAAGIWLPFRINEFQEGTYWSWKVAGVPATGHRVETEGDGSCKLTFEIPVLAAPYAYVCRIALNRIAEIIEVELR